MNEVLGFTTSFVLNYGNTDKIDFFDLSKEIEMTMEFVLGIVLLGLGALTLAARLFGWNQMFWKRQPMKEKFGDQAGEVIHFTAYTAMPIVIGLFFVVS